MSPPRTSASSCCSGRSCAPFATPATRCTPPPPPGRSWHADRRRDHPPSASPRHPGIRLGRRRRGRCRALSAVSPPAARHRPHPQPQARRLWPHGGPRRPGSAGREHPARPVRPADRPAGPPAAGLRAGAAGGQPAATSSSSRTPKTSRPWPASAFPARSCTSSGNGVDLDRFCPRPAEVRKEVRAELGVRRRPGGGRGRRPAGLGEGLRRAVRRRQAACSARRDDVVVVVAGPFDADKGDPLGVGRRAGGRGGRRALPGPPRRPRAALRRLRHLRPGLAPGGLPRSAMEAAASGLPIVATDIRGCREVVDHDRTGLLVPVRDAAALEAAIDRLADDAAARRRIGRGGGGQGQRRVRPAPGHRPHARRLRRAEICGKALTGISPRKVRIVSRRVCARNGSRRASVWRLWSSNPGSRQLS